MNVLEAEGLTKVFPGVVALDNISIAFEAGRVHCVVGENGAGKSTLIKCLTGVYQADAGQIRINGKLAEPNSELFEKVVFVPQEINLFPHMSVAENLFIPYQRTGGGMVNRKKLEEMALPIIQEYGIHARPDQMVRTLSVADQQLLQIARATMKKDFTTIIFDEPTSSLTTEDTKRVFSIVERQKAAGVAVVYISHKLDEVFAIGDDITVFQNGRWVANALVSQVDEAWIVQKMIGKYLDEDKRFYSSKVTGEEILRVEHLYGPGFRDASFSLHKGEILGFSGLIGAGRTVLMQAIYGLSKSYTGNVYYDGRLVNKASAANSKSAGIVYLPEDRKRMGLLPVMSVKSNISILALEKFTSAGILKGAEESTAAQAYAKRYDVRAASLDRQIRTLSGGNQQKAIIARSMLVNPKVIIMDEPTKGIDVGAKYEIYKLMNQLAEDGFAVILVSSELDEIVRCCNRIIVMHEEQIVGEFPQDTEKEILMNAMIGCPIQAN